MLSGSTSRRKCEDSSTGTQFFTATSFAPPTWSTGDSAGSTGRFGRAADAWALSACCAHCFSSDDAVHELAWSRLAWERGGPRWRAAAGSLAIGCRVPAGAQKDHRRKIQAAVAALGAWGTNTRRVQNWLLALVPPVFVMPTLKSRVRRVSGLRETGARGGGRLPRRPRSIHHRIMQKLGVARAESGAIGEPIRTAAFGA